MSNVADGVVRVLIPLLAIQLTGDVAVVALATATATLPWALTALPIGVLADRIDRRPIILCANAVRALILATVAIAATTGSLDLVWLYLAAFGLGVCEVAADLTAKSLLPMVVRRDQLSPANAWLQGAQTTLDEFLGPVFGGLLVAAGAWLAAGATSAMYATAVLVLLVLLPGAYRAHRPEGSTIRADLVEGLRFVWRHRLRRTIALMVAVMAGCWSAWTALLVVYATWEIGLSPSGYGLLLAMLAVGGLAGSVCAVPVERRWGRQAVMGIDVVATTLMLLAPALTTDPVLVAAAIVLGGMGSAMWNITVLSLVALITPEFLRGRAGAASRMVSWGTMPLGAAAGGLLASQIGTSTVFVLLAAGSACMIIPVLRITTPAAIDDAITTAERMNRRPG